MALLVTTLMIIVYLTVVSAQLDPFVKLKVPFKISPVDHFTTYTLQPYSVFGAKDCGGAGNVIQFLHQGCLDARPAVTCVTEINKLYDGYVYFIAGEDAKDLNVRVSLITTDGINKSVKIPLPDTSLKTGQPYALYITGMVEEELLGKLFTGRVEVLGDGDKSVQACSEIDFLAYKS